MLSLLLGLVIAPVVWLVTGFGQAKLIAATEEGLTLNTATVALAVLAGAGLAFGLVAATRISPLGPLAAGLVLIGGQVAYVARAEKITDLLPKEVLGVEGAFTLPAATGMAAVLGVGLLIALFSVGRWRKWPKFDQPDDAFLDGAAPIGAPTPSGARQQFGGDDPMVARPLGSSIGAPDEPTRAYAGASTGGDPRRYEAFGYVNDEPTRPASGWPEPHEQSWRPGSEADLDDSERTTRLPGSHSDTSPWSDPPRRLG
ncbi:MAG: hypothetical protein ACRDUA_17900 [Micromonosporaceae bacterium]